MKIVQVIGTLQIGGAENQVTQLLNGISAKRSKKIFSHFPRSDLSQWLETGR